MQIYSKDKLYSIDLSDSQLPPDEYTEFCKRVTAENKREAEAHKQREQLKRRHRCY